MTMTRQFKPSQLKPGLYDITASYAVSASYSQPSYLILTGSVFAQVNTTNNLFLIRSGSRDLLTITQSGVLVLSTQSAELTGSAPNGGMYFTSGAFFIGLDV